MAADLLLAIPVIGPALHIIVQEQIDTAFASCLLVAVAVVGGELRGPMERAVEFAKSRGVFCCYCCSLCLL